MDLKSAILHIVDGRIRVKVPGVKNTPVACRSLEARLGSLHGIDDAQANPTTGNVVIWYNPTRTEPSRILEGLRDMGYLTETGGTAPSRAGSPVGARVAEALFTTAAEVALRSLVTALI